jgi:hypothetical protein
MYICGVSCNFRPNHVGEGNTIVGKKPVLKREWRCSGCHYVGEVVGEKVSCKAAGALVSPPLMANFPRYDDCPHRNKNPLRRPFLNGEKLTELARYASSLRQKGMSGTELEKAISDFEETLRN